MLPSASVISEQLDAQRQHYVKICTLFNLLQYVTIFLMKTNKQKILAAGSNTAHFV